MWWAALTITVSRTCSYPNQLTTFCQLIFSSSPSSSSSSSSSCGLASLDCRSRCEVMELSEDLQELRIMVQGEMTLVTYL